MVGKELIQALVQGFSIETTPQTAAKVESFKTLLPAGTRVNITFLPGTNSLDTVATAARLRAEGMVPVPHIAARSIADESALEEYLKRLQGEALVDQVLVIGGGVTRPVGRFDSSVQLLATGLFEKYRIRRIGIAGHPEGTPDIAPAEVEKALIAKAEYGRATGAEMYLVTQFCFESAPVERWLDRLAQLGVPLPVWIGVPGPASIKTLLRYAQECGIGPSMRVVTRQAKNVARLLTVQTPDALLAGLALHRSADPGRRLRGIHLYPLGGFAKTCAWFSSVAEGRFVLGHGGTGFTLAERPSAVAS
jgi:methylenetetrahydrofolate reductase (NADH)